MGRLVRNHSTHIDGLIKLLTFISKSPKIKCVTPSILKRVKSNSEKLTLKVTIEVKGGFKLVARKGRMAQEVYILTELSKGQLEESINRALIRN